MSVLDLLITNAQVYDGLDAEPTFDHVGVVAGRIAYLGEDAALTARETVDADGRILCPGFIDCHGGSTLRFLLPGPSEHKLAQGVTTEILGQDGLSAAPVGPRLAAALQKEARELGLDLTWRGFGELAATLEHSGLEQNIGSLVGHSTLRLGALTHWQHVEPVELEAMRSALVTSLAEGALGFSSGLGDAPGAFADAKEIITFAQVAASYGGLYATHIRDERQGLDDAIEEAIAASQASGVRLLVSHLKSAGRANWGRLSDVIRRLEEARIQGTDVSFSVYPYTAEAARLRTYLPKELMAEGLPGLAKRLERSDWRHYALQWLAYRGADFDAMTLVTDSLPGHDARGMTVSAIALALGREPADQLVDLVLADPEAWVVYQCLGEDDVDAAVLSKESIVSSASWSRPVNAPGAGDRPHPRTYGAFTHYLERYAISGLLTFGDALRKITSMPADLFGLPDRGRISVGAAADLVLLNPNAIRSKATYKDPRQLAEGTDKVWVNGRLVFSEGQVVASPRGDGHEAGPGRFLRRRSAHGASAR